MKKILLMAAMLFLVMGFALATTSGLSVDISKYEPFPAEPGKYIEVWITAKNTGNTELSNVIVKITPNYPFSLDPTTNDTFEIGTLTGGQEKISRIKIRVDANAVQGENFLDVTYKYGGYNWLTKRIPVFVQTHDAILSVKQVSTEPSSLVPGKISVVVFELENMADSFLSDIKIRINFLENDLPFSPIDSTTEKRIYVIESGKTETMEFNIMALPDAKSGVYRIPVEITYSDSTGNSYTRTDLIGLVVGDKPVLQIYVDKSSVIKGGQAGEVQILLVNPGLTDIKFLNIELLDSEDFEKISTNKVYIGNLDSDDIDTVEFKLYVKPTSEQNIVLPINAIYLDANNNEYTEKIDVPLRIYTSGEISSYGLGEKNNNIWIVWLLIAAGAGYFIYKKFWKRK